MNNLKAKLKKQGGFTLIEMLIVVAIIAILIAVSIPLVNGALERARDATDQANERAAKAEGTLILMDIVDLPTDVSWDATAKTAAMYYNAENGVMVKDYDDALSGGKGYGKCQGTSSCYISAAHGTATNSNDNKVLKVTLNKANTTVTLEWADS